jgi:protein SCO1/2
MTSLPRFAGVLGIAFIALGCNGPVGNNPASRPANVPSAAATSTSTSTNRQVYEVKGVVREVLPEQKKARITHEEIPGYMEAMTMMLDVKNPQELVGLQAGDNIVFRMVVTDDDGWIEQIRKSDGPRTPLPAEAPLRRVRYVEALSIGDPVPDYAFTNMLGVVTRLSELRGRAVALTFIFTRCPFPTFCPRLNTAFQQTHDKLKSTPGAATNWTLLSVTMDPAYDTPERLKAYAERYNPDPAHWLFATGDLTEITAIGEQFGLQFWRPNPNDPISHNMRTVIVDATGRVRWIANDSEFKPDDLAHRILQAAAIKPEP